MAICLITTNPSETAKQYETVMSHLRDSGPVPPEGARLLIAGQGPEGWRAVSVWDGRLGRTRARRWLPIAIPFRARSGPGIGPRGRRAECRVLGSGLGGPWVA